MKIVDEPLVIFAEEAEVAIDVEGRVDDAPVNKLQCARGVDPRPVRLDLGLSEADVPGVVGHVVDNRVAHDVGVAVWQILRVVGRESQLDRVEQLRREDITVETEAQAFHAGLYLVHREVLVEMEGDHILHAEPQGHLVELVLRLEGDAFADFDVRHVAHPLHKLLVFVDRPLQGVVGGDVSGDEVVLGVGCQQPAGAHRSEEELS